MGPCPKVSPVDDRDGEYKVVLLGSKVLFFVPLSSVKSVLLLLGWMDNDEFDWCSWGNKSSMAAGTEALGDEGN